MESVGVEPEKAAERSADRVIGPASTAVSTSEENGMDCVKILGIAVYNARIYVDIFIGIFMYL